MKMMKERPLAVTILAWLYIAVGAMGFSYHFRALLPPMEPDALWIESVRLLAVVAGIYMLRGNNWARWLAVVWIAAHVVLSMFNSIDQTVVHALFCAAIAFLLFFRRENAVFFQTT
jgi:hypothetical protein